MADKEKNASTDSKSQKLKLTNLSYLVSIIVAFIIPVFVLGKSIWKYIPKKAFFIASGIVAILGWIWSWIVSSHHWWTFGSPYILGINVVPHLPLEEFLFYPFGGMLCILIYIAASKSKTFTNAATYWIFLILGTVAFGVLSYLTLDHKPYYLISQIILYNLLCSLLLAPFVANKINLLGLSIPIILIGTAGFFWDYIAFKYGWWTYYAISGIHISIVPVDDFNFFLFAPGSAISIYLLICRILKSPEVIPTK